jgi:tellurite resistance protein
MIIRRTADEALRPDQVRAMAHGLYYLAAIDGVTTREKELIQSFLREGNVELDPDKLAEIPFSREELTHSLDTMFLRKAFLRACVLVARADGEISSGELAELRRLAQALGITEPIEDLTADLSPHTLD